MVVICHIQIGVAIVVIVAGCDTYAFIGVVEASRFGNICEREFAAWIQVIPEQPVARFPARGQWNKSLALGIGGIALDQKNVHISVVVVVDQRGAGSNHLRQKVIARRAGILPEVDACLFGDIFEEGGCVSEALIGGRLA